MLEEYCPQWQYLSSTMAIISADKFGLNELSSACVSRKVIMADEISNENLVLLCTAIGGAQVLARECVYGIISYSGCS